MKDTFKNSIIGAFAIFGLVTLISSSNNAPTVIHEGTATPKYQLIPTKDGNSVYKLNKETGEVWVRELLGLFREVGHKQKKE